MQPPGNLANLFQGVRREDGDTAQRLRDIGWGRWQFGGDEFQLQADGGQRLAGAGVQFAPQSLAFHLNLADRPAPAAPAPAPLLEFAEQAPLQTQQAEEMTGEAPLET